MLTLRSIHRQLGLLFLVVLCAWPGIGAADEVDRLVDEIQRGILAGDAAGDHDGRLAGYGASLQSLLELAGATNDRRTADALAELQLQSVTADTLRTAMLSSLLALMTTAEHGANSGAWRASVLDLLASLDSEAYRISGLVQLADATSGEARHKAILAAKQHYESVSELIEAHVGSSAVASIALVASTGGDDSLVEEAIAEFWPSRARAFVRYVLAKLSLQGGPHQSSSNEELAKLSHRAIADGKLTEAIRLALAIDTQASTVRNRTLVALLDASLEANDRPSYPVLATAFADTASQLVAISKIVDHLLKTDDAQDVAALVASLPYGAPRANIEFSLARALSAAGRSDESQLAFDRGQHVLAHLSGPPRNAALAEAIEGATAAGDLDGAIGLFDQIELFDQAEDAMRLLSKSLADEGRIPDARRVFERIQNDDDREYALSGIAVAELKAGNVEAGLSAIASILSPEYRSRALAELARVEARADRFDDALRTAESIFVQSYKLDAIVRIAQAAVQLNKAEAFVHAAVAALRVAVDNPDPSGKIRILFEIAARLTGGLSLADASDVIRKSDRLDSVRRAFDVTSRFVGFSR